MRAARLHAVAADGAEPDVRVDEVPVPTPGPREVLVRVLACGVCASDLHVMVGVTPPGELPMTLGHEVAGDVAAVGPGVTDWAVGDRVVLMPGWACGDCGYCRSGRENLCRQARVMGVDMEGGQADFVVADTRAVTHVPRSIPVEQAAIIPDAVATAYHALKRAGVGEGTTVAVVGLGGLGIHAVQLARLAGAGTVVGVDIDPVARDRAIAAGADEVVDGATEHVARRVRELTEGGVDRSLEFVGSNATIDQAIKMLAPGGRAALVGLTPERLETLPSALLVSNELEVVGSFGATRQDVDELVDLVDAGRLALAASVTHVHAADDVLGAFRRLATRDGSPGRVVVRWGD